MLPDAPGGKLPYFPQDFRFPAAPVGTADQGNGAEGASVGASFSDPGIGHVGRRRQQAVLLKIAQIVLTGVNRFALQGFPDSVRQGGILINAQQQVDFRHLFQQILLIPLGKASGDNQQSALTGFLVFCHLENGIDGFFLGWINESAGIDHQNIRL